jgi:hypothetical protein
LVTFGGTDRDQQHFNDVSFLTDGVWVKKNTKGDIPTVRSGHAVAAFGRMMFLFGGMGRYLFLNVLLLEILLFEILLFILVS